MCDQTGSDRISLVSRVWCGFRQEKKLRILVTVTSPALRGLTDGSVASSNVTPDVNALCRFQIEIQQAIISYFLHCIHLITIKCIYVGQKKGIWVDHSEIRNSLHPTNNCVVERKSPCFKRLVYRLSLLLASWNISRERPFKNSPAISEIIGWLLVRRGSFIPLNFHTHHNAAIVPADIMSTCKCQQQ